MKPTHLTTDRVMKEFRDRFVEKNTDDWNRLKSVREQEPLEFLREALSQAQEEARGEVADKLKLLIKSITVQDDTLNHRVSMLATDYDKLLAHLNKINSGQSVTNHFPDIGKMVKLSKGRKV